MRNGAQRTGDSVAAAIDRYGTMVYRLAYARTRSAADADDIFQEVFLKLLTHAPAFQSDGHEKAWLIRSTVNASVNLLKSAWRRLWNRCCSVNSALPPSVLKNWTSRAPPVFWYRNLFANRTENGRTVPISCPPVSAIS